ncbi:MAG TPA: YadA-like family protein, partial [Pseudoxanthomonas sp.]|nr:YadA-like family protein [Pseudoxanthomonas sp.]
VEYDDAGKATATLKGENGTQVKNVADGVDAMDAVNVQQMEAGDAQTLATSKTYTDTKSTQTLASANAYTDSKFASWNDSFTQFQNNVEQRFAKTDARIDRMGAMGGAMSAAAMNTAGLPGQNRVGVGFGMQGGRSAMAVNYQRLVRSNASVSIGGAISGDESSISAGAGFSW